ncbi:type IV secretory system conjugative DNA transfer family protein [Hyphomicrobium sp.]|uniref:type IV secretory system conjugative DNA transfer family protein n=1 Tax=Hyphomicrobium sp. TaxID=82 RepID=UPI0025BBF172|nr:type IV secretory system conjugative DNA transfer family protein [Hyphomicrobium sp.]MCC7250443.1 type IV secretory system conjugative DNA transfer family protein [Hyphomicrobium sp.]
MNKPVFIDAEFPPRGSGIAGRHEAAPSTRWGHPWELSPNWTWQPGRVLLGHWQQRLIGLDDDRHVVTVAGNRAGKSSTVLIPNLRRYPGSVIVLDPKGELARATAEARMRMGQRVYVLDPFGETGFQTAAHNPFDELGHGNPSHIAADAAQVADALIIANNKDPHWTDSAKNLVRGLALHLLSTTSTATLRQVRSLLNGTPAELDALFTAMTESGAFDGIVANIGRSFLGKLESGGRELQGILSTAQEQTAPLDDIVAVTERSDFALSDLATSRISIYLVLPGMRMGTHYRWLRLVIQLALAALERNRVPRGELPVWFVLEEFPSLGHMRSIETAAGLMAGFGIKLWSVLQDFTQLKTHYPKSWETFLGNAGIIQAFGNADLTTTEHLSKLLGSTQVIERQAVRLSGHAMSQGDSGIREHLRSVRLLDPNEITTLFSRETNRQLILVPGRPPIYLERLPHDAH